MSRSGAPPGPSGRAGSSGPGGGPLARRLRYLAAVGREAPGRAGAQAGPGKDAPPARGQDAALLQGAGDERAADALAGWERVGSLTWRRQVRSPSPLEEEQHSELLLPPELRAEDLLFFDTETTGLSGGAGSYVFLFGSAWLEGRELVCEQLFLGDFPGEPEFLQALAARLENHRLFLSYNGRAFDAPLLRSRFVLNRMPFALGRQEDLLFWARRLWRRFLPDCSLGSVERGILGVERGQDVAGWEVPGIYLSWLSGGGDGRLSLVMEHNLQDVRSLARLYDHVNRLLRVRELPADTDGAALGSYLLRAGHGHGAEVLHESFAGGDRRAGRALGLHYKRRGEWSQAVSVWEAMARERSVFAAVELAKYHEHRLRDPAAALEWVRRIEAWKAALGPEERAALAHRRRRLERKCGAAAAGGPAGRVSGEGAGAGTGEPATGQAGFASRVKALRELSDRRRGRNGTQKR